MIEWFNSLINWGVSLIWGNGAILDIYGNFLEYQGKAVAWAVSVPTKP